MKNLLYSAIFLAVFGPAFSLQAQTIVNFSVDMSLQPEISAEGVFLTGWFNGWLEEPMDDSDGDGIYTLSISLPPGIYQFKFRNGSDGWEDIVVNHPASEIPGDCVTGAGNDRFVEVGTVEMDVRYCFNYCVDCSVVTEGAFAPAVLNPFPQPTPDSRTAITLIDIDDDDDLDVYISHRELVGSCFVAVAFEFWENQGTVGNPEFVKFPGDIHGMPSWTSGVGFVDVDADGDPDAFINNSCSNTTISFHENTGDAAHPQFSSTPTETFNIVGIGYAGLAFGDLDGDGDYDALINGIHPAQFYFLENTGTPTSFAFGTPEINPFGLSIPLSNGFELSQFVDWDCDGDLDILNAHLSLPSSSLDRLLYLHENTGTPTAPAFATMELLSNQFITAQTWGDMDGDGDMDAFSGKYYFENISETGCLTPTINRRKSSAEIALFPNPASGFLMVKMTGETPPQQVTVEVFNSLGVLTRQLAYDAWDFSTGVQVDVSDLAPGFYTLKVGSASEFASGKFLKTE